MNEENPLPGEPGHFRYLKDKAAGAKAPEAKAEIEETVNEKVSFTKEGAKKLNRKDQEELLSKREVKFSDKDKEVDLIKKILNSNPK